MKTTYYAIYCDNQDNDCKFMRVAYAWEVGGSLTYNGYSPMADWKDATLFETKEAATNVLNNNQPGPNIKGNLKLVTIEVDIHD